MIDVSIPIRAYPSPTIDAILPIVTVSGTGRRWQLEQGQLYFLLGLSAVVVVVFNLKQQGACSPSMIDTSINTGVFPERASDPWYGAAGNENF